jgi:hypothetical protein
MTTATALLSHAKELGIRFEINGDSIRAIAKPEILRPIVADLKTHKAEIIRLLSPKPEPAKQLVCYSCRGADFWTSIHGVKVCRLCHPPASPELEVSVCK